MHALVERHDSLRTRIVSVDGVVEQRIDPFSRRPLELIDLSSSPSPDLELEALRSAQAFIDEPIDPATEPLFEARMWKLAEQEHFLVLLVDHLISDGTSNGILVRELWSLYDHAARNEPPVLSPLPVQFADYAYWQAQTHAAWLREHAAHWREHLNDVPPTVIPDDSGLPSAIECVGATAHIPFGSVLTTMLRESARRERTLLSVLVLAAYSVALSLWCRQKELLIAFAFHGRFRPDLQNVVGFVANHLLLRIRVDENDTPRDLIARVKAEIASAFRHHDYDRVPDLVPGCRSDAIFNWQTTHSIHKALDHHAIAECAATRHPESQADLQISPLPVRSPSNAKFSPVIFDTPDGLHLAIAYRADELASTTIDWFANTLFAAARAIAEQPTATLGSLVASLELRPLELSAPIEVRSTSSNAPLMAEQRRLYILRKHQSPNGLALGSRMCASAARISGPLDVGSLEAGIAQVVQRHESLRTRFVTVGDVTKQLIDAPGVYRLETIDLSHLPSAEADRQARQLAQDFQDEKIDLSRGPLFEARLFRIAANQHVLILLIDHMVSDGLSNALLGKEIWLAYDAITRRQVPAFAPLPVQVADYAVWQARTLSAWKRDHAAYWKEHLAGVPRTHIPRPSASSNGNPPAGITAHFQFGEPLSTRLRDAARRERMQPSTVGLAIYAIALARWCRQNDLLIRTPVHGRHGRPELEHVIGFIVNLLYLRIQVNGHDTLLELLSRVEREMGRAFQHLDFDRVPDLVAGCVTDLAFHWRSASWHGRTGGRPRDRDSPLRIQPFFVRLPDWPWNFWSVFDDTPAGICATVHYWPHLVEAAAVEQFGVDIRAVAEAIGTTACAHRLHHSCRLGSAWPALISCWRRCVPIRLSSASMAMAARTPMPTCWTRSPCGESVSTDSASSPGQSSVFAQTIR